MEGICPLRCDKFVSISATQRRVVLLNSKKNTIQHICCFEPQKQSLCDGLFKLHVDFVCSVRQKSLLSQLIGFSVSFQDIECYVIDNNGFVLISKQQSDVSLHTHTHSHEDDQIEVLVKLLTWLFESFWTSCYSLNHRRQYKLMRATANNYMPIILKCCFIIVYNIIYSFFFFILWTVLSTTVDV